MLTSEADRPFRKLVTIIMNMFLHVFGLLKLL